MGSGCCCQRPGPALISPDIEELLAVWPLGRELDLPAGSVSVVAGAYKGRVMQLLAEVYPDYGAIHGFEPQSWAVEEARRRLGSYQGEGQTIRFRDCTVHPYAIGTETREVWIDEWGTDAASIMGYEDARTRGLGLMLEYELGLTVAGISNIDLFVMNMEGYEFELLPYLWSRAPHVTPDRLTVQWHYKPSGIQREKQADIEAMLRTTHDLLYDDSPRWQHWRRR